MTIGFMVLWFHPFRFWDIEMTISFVVSWFLPLRLRDIEMTIGFMVSPTPSLGHQNDERFYGVLVLWFRDYAHSISGTSK